MPAPLWQSAAIMALNPLTAPGMHENFAPPPFRRWNLLLYPWNQGLAMQLALGQWANGKDDTSRGLKSACTLGLVLSWCWIPLCLLPCEKGWHGLLVDKTPHVKRPQPNQVRSQIPEGNLFGPCGPSQAGPDWNSSSVNLENREKWQTVVILSHCFG